MTTRYLSDAESKARSKNEEQFCALATDLKSFIKTIIYCYLDKKVEIARVRNAEAAKRLAELFNILDTIPDRYEHIDNEIGTLAFSADTKFPGQKNKRLFAQCIPANGTFILDGENVGGSANPVDNETMAALQKVIDGYIKKRQMVIGKEKLTEKQMASNVKSINAAIVADQSHSK